MRRALILATPLALVLVLGACGDDDDSPADTATASTKPDTTDSADDETGITIPEISIPEISIPEISIPDFSIPDLSIPDVSLPENADELFSQVFPNLDDEQIDCLVENLSGDLDPSKVPGLLDECDIDPQQLLPGG